MSRRFGKPGQAGHRYLAVVDGKGRWNREVVLDDAALARPPHEGHRIPTRKRDSEGWRPTRVFLGSMTDHFHDQVTSEMFMRVVRWMALGDVTWQVVTKRPERAASLLAEAARTPLPLGCRDLWPTIHLLATVEDQQRADERVPALLEAAPYVNLVGLSVEPLLGPVDLRPWIDRLGWVIVGGESGRGARPCDVAWIRDVVQQCADARVPCFVKQLGGFPTDIDHGELRLPMHDAKGGDPSEWPADLRVRQWPKA